MQENTSDLKEQNTIDAGTYEVLKQRLNKSSDELQNRMDSLNEVRKETFGNIPTTLLKTEKISTENNCIPRDMMAVGELFIFGYNVHIGLKSEVELSDVFSVYKFDNEHHTFHEQPLSLIDDTRFLEDFKQLYKYYKHTTFAKFVVIGPHLYFKFHTAKDGGAIKAFKFLIDGDSLNYVDNRSDHEIRFPDQHDFDWIRATRDSHKEGKYPHISIMDKVFVETIGGDLTIKVEDNTDTGEGIYAETVEQKEQSLDDAEIHYAHLGNLIILKIRPYLEETTRYFVYNQKLIEVHRIDSIKDACVLLPDDQGIIFSHGYYLQNGTLKIYDNELGDMRFEQRNTSPNGEDYMYVFYCSDTGDYVLLSYNRITQSVDAPIVCSGFSFFRNGEMVYFKTDHEPKKHHSIQLWQTPFVHPDYETNVQSDSYLFKIGNKEIVRAMAECNDLLKLLQKEEAYDAVYQDIAKKSNEISDSYFWIGHEETFNLKAVLNDIHEHALVAIEEFEKVKRVRKNTSAAMEKVFSAAEDLSNSIKRKPFKEIGAFVDTLSKLRTLKGEAIQLKELRYVDLEEVEEVEKNLNEQNEVVSKKCVTFLLGKEALTPYKKRVAEQESKIASLKKVSEIDKTDEENGKIAIDLELLIEIVSNLKIEDATQTTAIIDSVSDIYAELNKVKVSLKQKRKTLYGTEAKAEFAAQLRLIGQSIINYLDLSNTPQSCEENMTKLMVQLEELEGKFPDFDEFLPEIASKREEVYQAFENKKLQLVEKRNKKANSLFSAAERILKSIGHKVKGFTEVKDINAYFASDLMVSKVSDTIAQLKELDDAVKADDLQSRLNSTKEEAIRQLKDKQDLFVGGENIIQFGKHQFSVNIQALDIGLVNRDNELYYHLSGTNFFEKMELPIDQFSPEILTQELVSENHQVYRGEYLAYQYFQHLKEKNGLGKAMEQTMNELGEEIRSFMSVRYQEGYQKGVHDSDALVIFTILLEIGFKAGLLKFSPIARACGMLFWEVLADDIRKEAFMHRIIGQASIKKHFPEHIGQQTLIEDIVTEMKPTFNGMFEARTMFEAASYLIEELPLKKGYVSSKKGADLLTDFKKSLKSKKSEKEFSQVVESLRETPLVCYQMILDWLQAYTQASGSQEEIVATEIDYLSEVAAFLLTESFKKDRVINIGTDENITGLIGEHVKIRNGAYHLNFHQFMEELGNFCEETVPAFHAFQDFKKDKIEAFREEIRLNEFKPRVLGSFVRNQLIDEVYLPLIGDNLAKQIGTAGKNKRTDLMGMLLLVSPPGYGKTTLMEYIANRIGLIFMKINGPAIGHKVDSLDPKEAGNTGAEEELKKLNLAFEMGDNVMIYLDDIQHCNPEFLQKFISLCDGQRKIEGVFKGRPKTYDLRGKRVCVVMAGNPYTESGEKFRIPDMLANRADTYNLGDIIGSSDRQFKMSYVENALTSNPVLKKLANKSRTDIHQVIIYTETKNRELLDFESNIPADELNEYSNIIEKMLYIRDIILKVNMRYIESAAQSDEYRTEPPFKLQGSYRNMNKLVEKVMPVMNEEEVKSLLLSHYENEVQTLTSDAEANLLAFKEIMAVLNQTQQNRWKEIKEIFNKQQRKKGYGTNNQMLTLIEKLEDFSQSLKGIKQAIEKGG